MLLHIYFRCIFLVFFSLFFISVFQDNSFAEQELSPHQQWNKFGDPDTLTCKQGFLLLQKTNGYPTCITPNTYLKLIDRGYGSHNLSSLSTHPEMLNLFLDHMVSNEKLIFHWHEMLKKNNTVMTQTLDDWVLQMKSDSKLLKNMLGPMTSDPKLRDKMIQIMKDHPTMELFLKQDPVWMESIHRPALSLNENKNNDLKNECSTCNKLEKNTLHSSCSWCPEYETQSSHNYSEAFSKSEKIMNIVHGIWINSGMSKNVHDLMINDPAHMAQMAEYLMEPMLNAVMDDDFLREQMVDLMLEHEDFMNSIRHTNTSQRH